MWSVASALRTGGSKAPRMIRRSPLLVSRPLPKSPVTTRKVSTGTPQLNPSVAVAREESAMIHHHSPLPPRPSSIHSATDEALHSYRSSNSITTQSLEPITIIRLPEMRPSQPKEAGKFSEAQLPEQMAVMYACLATGDMERARRIFLALHRNNPEDMLVLGDIKMHNSFMEAYINAKPQPRTKDALRWFESLAKYHVKPDLTSFAILIKGFLKMDSMHTAKVMMMEMQKAGFAVEELRECNTLQPSDIERIDKIASLLKPAAARLAVPAEATQDIKEPAEAVQQYAEVKPVRNSKNEPVIGVQLMRNTLDALARKDLDRYDRQLKLEEKSYQAALEKLEHDRHGIPEQMNLRPLKSYLWKWHEALTASIKQEIKRINDALEKKAAATTGVDRERIAYGPFIKMLPAEKLSIITILELLRLNNSGGIADGMKSARALIAIGKAIETEHNAEQFAKKNNKALVEQKINVHQLYGNGRLFNMAVRKAASAKHEALHEAGWTPLWPESTRAKVGSVLTTLLMDCAKVHVPSHNPETGEEIIEDIPAFYHTYQYAKGQKIGVIKVHSKISEILSKEPVGAVIHPRLLPMLVHPRPWLSYNNGGYLNAQSTIMRIRHCPQQYDYLKKAHEEGLLFRVYNGLDVLGRTRWAVNKRVLSVVLEAWNSGKAFAKIPAAADQLVEPPKPDDYETSTKAKAKWLAEVRKMKLEAKNHHSLRCDVNYKVEIARAFADEPMFFPHNLDFRGRAYPIPPLFNHLGNDLCRGLLMFDEAKPLGPKGFTWLKIHLANLAGYDKHSLSARAQYTVDRLEDIFDSADNPMTGKQWWLQAEDPWQCLATCIEITEAIRSGNPETYRSRIPVHQDGTCNGLQHYAALGGDMAGAQQVNLVPSDSPQDVYSGVAKTVERLLEKQAADGVEAAQILAGKISRKIVKQTVMTNVYGVTFVGARAQIENRLKETDGIPEDQVRQLSTYLTQQVFASLGELFTGARAIQDWLAESARRIAKSVPKNVVDPEEAAEIEETLGAGKKKSKSASRKNIASQQMTSVIWTTPLNLPIVQPYRKMEQKQVKTNLQSVTIKDPSQASPVNVQKQRTAFPPNFIHSLDATHMLMSAAGCVEAGLTFASVHDSYWTHACDVEVMNEVLRDQFIRLHSNNIMENLRNEFMERYKDYLYPVTLVIANPGEPVGEGMIAWDDERLKKKSMKLSSNTNSSNSEFEADPEAPKDPLMTNDDGTVVNGSRKSSKASSATATAAGMFNFGDEEDDEHDLSSVVIEEDEEEIEAEAKALGKALRKGSRKRSTNNKLFHSWEPLTFPPLPDRGEFDVSKVAESDYFFS